jgi:hypothetical protein
LKVRRTPEDQKISSPEILPDIRGEILGRYWGDI